MEIKLICPLGSECETAKNDVIYRCAWYVKLRGKDPQSEQEIDEYRCAMQWMPLLQVEHSLFERQTGAAVESMRNETVEAVKTSFLQLGDGIAKGLSGITGHPAITEDQD